MCVSCQRCVTASARLQRERVSVVSRPPQANSGLFCGCRIQKYEIRSRPAGQRLVLARGARQVAKCLAVEYERTSKGHLSPSKQCHSATAAREPGQRPHSQLRAEVGYPLRLRQLARQELSARSTRASSRNNPMGSPPNSSRGHPTCSRRRPRRRARRSRPPERAAHLRPRATRRPSTSCHRRKTTRSSSQPTRRRTRRAPKT